MKPTPKNSWIKVGLMLGAILYVFKFIIGPLFFDKDITVLQAFVGVPFWAIGGLGIGYLTKVLSPQK